MSDSSLGHTPSGAWEFDDKVTACFDDMLQRSIPQYEVMRQACVEIARPHMVEDFSVLDLGCSRGQALARMMKEYGDAYGYRGIEVSAPMREAARVELARFGEFDLLDHDLREPFLFEFTCVALSVLTLQFTPIEHRQRIVRDVYLSLVDGGAFIVVEKVLGNSAEIDQNMVDRYYAYKQANGYSWDEIQRKRLSLEGRLVPVTARWNEELLRGAGFGQVDCFWRWMNFAAWIAVK